MQCLIKLESPNTKSDAKLELITMASDLMPEGKPKFLSMVKYPMISTLVQQEGKKKILALLILMVKDFCSSLNVVRNMNEGQMIEAGAMLLDECGNFRMEDYLMMFQLAKRGELIKIYDRIDLQVISELMDSYWKRRHRAAEDFFDEEVAHLDSLGNTKKFIDDEHPMDTRLKNTIQGIANGMSSMNTGVEEKIGSKAAVQQLKAIEQRDSELIKKKQK